MSVMSGVKVRNKENSSMNRCWEMESANQRMPAFMTSPQQSVESQLPAQVHPSMALASFHVFTNLKVFVELRRAIPR